MGKVEKISVALTPELASTVREAVASGDYASTSEVMRDALRGWQRQQQDRASAVAELQRLVAEADASGYQPWDGIEHIIAEGRQRIARKV